MHQRLHVTPGQQSVLAVAIASSVPLAGTLLFAAGAKGLVALAPRLIPFAVGAMLGAAVFHLLPDALARASDREVVLFVAALGFAAFAIVDQLAHRAAPLRTSLGGVASGRLFLTVASDCLHNLIDGILIATTFLEEPALGVITAAAVALHEVPRELGTFALCVSGGLSVRASLGVTAATAVVAVFGALLAVSLGPAVSSLGLALVPFAAGNFLYLAGSILWDSRDLLRDRGVRTGYLLLLATGLVVTLVASR